MMSCADGTSLDMHNDRQANTRACTRTVTVGVGAVLHGRSLLRVVHVYVLLMMHAYHIHVCLYLYG